MKYIFEVNIETDGDFRLPFIPCGMKYDGYSKYAFCKSYTDRKQAIDDIIKICTFLKENMQTHKDYIKSMWDRHVDCFVEKLSKSSESINEIVEEYMNGNYDGTEWIFHSESRMFEFSFPVTDEEFDRIRRNDNHIIRSDIKNAVLALFEK